MKPFGFIKATLGSGILVILPIGLLLVVFMKIADLIEPLTTPVVEWLPRELHFPVLVTLLLVLLACLVAGLLARTRAGQGVGTSVEDVILHHIPGYSTVRSLTRRIANAEESEKFAPALVEIDEALAPAFVVEEHPDGRYTVFVPDAPTPAIGAILVVARERVHFVDAPFMKTVKCVSSWGVGAAELVQAMRPPEETQE